MGAGYLPPSFVVPLANYHGRMLALGSPLAKIALNPVRAYGKPVDQVHFGSIYPDPTPLNII
jgi:hypothetical protein